MYIFGFKTIKSIHAPVYIIYKHKFEKKLRSSLTN